MLYLSVVLTILHSLKATGAHIAFNAPSRGAVDAFFLAALKAGGTIHGEPAVREQGTGYYSAAVVDLDGNSIEAMHREREKVASTNSEIIADDKATKNTTKIIVNNVTAPAMVVSHSSARIKDDGEMSTKALIGTLLGAAAGAAVAYAMTKVEDENFQPPITQTITYQTADAPKPKSARSTVSSRKPSRPAASSHVSRNALLEIDYPQAPMSGSGESSILHYSPRPKYLEGPKAASGQNLASTLIETFIPPSEVRRFPPHAVARSQTDSIVQRSVAIQDPDMISQHSKLSRAASSTAKTLTLKDFAPVPRSSTGTETRLARGVLLPISKAGSSTSRHSHLVGAPVQGLPSELGSVAPSDSVSQAESRRSKASKRSSHHSHSRREEAAMRDDNSSHASRQTVRYRGIKSGGKKDSAVSLPMRPSSKASAHRSVKSFLDGM